MKGKKPLNLIQMNYSRIDPDHNPTLISLLSRISLEDAAASMT